LRGSVWFGLVRVLVLREARKCRTEQKSCKSELGGLSVKPHKVFPPAAIMLIERNAHNAPQVKSQSIQDQQKIKCFVVNGLGEEASVCAETEYQPADRIWPCWEQATTASITVPWPGDDLMASLPPTRRNRSCMLTNPRPSDLVAGSKPLPVSLI
jgi:hypothetical protein